MPPTRETDHGQFNGKEPVIKITREIPMPWILTVLAAVAVQAAGLVFGMRSISEKQTEQSAKQAEIGTEVKSINDKLNRADVAGAKAESEVKFKLEDLSRRVTVIEAREGRTAK